MESVHKIEKTMEGWFKDVPHLPAGFTKWLAENAWWLTVIGVVFGVFGLFGTLTALTVGSVVLTAVGGPALGGLVFFGSLLSLIVTGITLVFEAMAISPLKASAKRGWDLVFLASLVGGAGGAISALLSVNIGGLVVTAVAFAISMYVIFEVRKYFSVKKAEEKKSA